MNYKQANLSLTDMLGSLVNFSFFEELIDIEKGKRISQHDLFKINKIIEDIYVYLRDMLERFREIQRSRAEDEVLNWFYEGKEGVYGLIKNMESIDSMISELLVILDTDGGQEQINGMLSRFEETSDLLLDVKKYIITYKRKIDISINFKEINESVMESLAQEIDDCLKKFYKVSELKLSSPKRHLPQFNLEVITSKMRINDLSLTNNLSMKSIRLPTFNEFDESLYNDYLSLDARINPLQISLEILPVKIEEFNVMCGTLFPNAVDEIHSNHANLMKKWDYLQKQLQNLKRECLDTKWHEIFKYLIKEITLKCNIIVQKLNIDSKITDEIGSTYKLCSNSITLINKAFKEEIIYDSSLVSAFNETLLTGWQTLNNLLTNSIPQDPQPKTISEFDENGLKNFQTLKRITTPVSSKEKTRSGLGIDLGIDVENSNVPFSIQKKDRIKVFFSNNLDSRKKSLKNTFTNLNDLETEIDYDDELTLVNKTPSLQYEIDSLNLNKLKIKDNFNSQLFLNKLLNKIPSEPSNIPIICEDYLSRGLPVIKKKFGHGFKPTRIPSISPNHPVFNSPERQLQKGLLKPPLFLINRSPIKSPIKPTFGDKDEDVFRKPTNKPTIVHFLQSSKSSSRPSSSLNGLTTPDLSYQPPPFNSTSPERPSSSIGSRFDDKHLIQPINASKPKWK